MDFYKTHSWTSEEPAIVVKSYHPTYISLCFNVNKTSFTITSDDVPLHVPAGVESQISGEEGVIGEESIGTTVYDVYNVAFAVKHEDYKFETVARIFADHNVFDNVSNAEWAEILRDFYPSFGEANVESDEEYDFYSILISAFVNAKYTQDEVTAIQNNFINAYTGIVTTPKDEEYRQDYLDFANYRITCKEKAAAILEFA